LGQNGDVGLVAQNALQACPARMLLVGLGKVGRISSYCSICI